MNNFLNFERGLKTAALAGFVLLLPQNGLAQGFGGTMGLGAPKTVNLKQLLPATVNLNQKRIKIQAISAVKTNEDLVTVLQTKVVTFIQKDPRFIVDDKNPQTLLKFTVTNSYIDQKTYQVPGPNNTMQNCVGYTGKMEVSYQAFDTSTNAPLDSENLVAAIENQQPTQATSFRDMLHVPGGRRGTCGTEAKSTPHEAQDALVDEVVRQMAQRAAPSDTVIEVKLPGKKLEPLSRLALAQRWQTLEEEADKAEKLPKPEDDAYRIYLVALAKEAQAYDLARIAQKRENGSDKGITEQQADADFQKAMSLIDEARKLYKDAIQAKPNEKVFQEPDNRMEKAVTVYATISRHKDEYKKAVEQQKVAKATPPPTDPVGKKVTAGSTPAAANSGNTPLDQIVKYCQAGMPMETITDYIKDPSFLSDARASAYKFDIKTDPFTLNANCKTNAATIQRMMRARLTPQPARPK